MDNYLVWLGICCVAPFLVASVVTIWAIRSGSRYLAPDLAEMQSDFTELEQTYPNASKDELAKIIIGRQARRSGIVGALTSVGGIFVLPFGLTIDIYTSTRIQNSMLQFLAWVYDDASQASRTLSLNNALSLQAANTAKQVISAGSERASRALSRRILVIVGQKSFAKLIPIVGLAVGFAVNYATTRGIGSAAYRYYSGN